MAALTWVRLDCGFPRNHKVLALLLEKEGHRAALVFMFAMTHCGEQGTDGFIPREVLPLIHARPRDMAALMGVGLVDEVPGGWLIPNWSEYQATSEENARRSERARKAAASRWSKAQLTAVNGGLE
jgi:hypothetical protein